MVDATVANGNTENFAFAIFLGAAVLAVKLSVLAAGYGAIKMGYRLIDDGVEATNADMPGVPNQAGR